MGFCLLLAQGCSTGCLSEDEMYYGNLPPGFSLRQHRPMNATDGPAGPDRNVSIAYDCPNWSSESGSKTTVITVPFAFEAAIIGPNSHIGSAIIRPSGKQPYILSVASPILGSFEAGALLSPSKIFQTGLGGYLQIIFYPKAPSVVPLKRPTYTRFVQSGSVPFLQTTDPDFIKATNYLTICDERRRLSFIFSPPAGKAVYLQFLIGTPWNFDNPTILDLGLTGVGTIDDTNVITNTSDLNNNIETSVPAGANAVQIMDLSTGSQYIDATMTYLMALSDD
jgi:hypothetical protein